MANRESKSNASWLSRLLTDGFWLSAGVLAIADWFSGKPRPEGELARPDVHFEPTDANVRGVLLTGFGVLLFLYLSGFVLYFVFQHFKQERAAESPPPLPIATHGVALPPEPRLERSPHRDLQELRAAEEFQLTHYQWLDRQKGTIAIPIDRAMDLLVQRGIPPQKGQPNLYYPPQVGTRMTGFEGKVEPEPR
jgi:hypothetical protein